MRLGHRAEGAELVVGHGRVVDSGDRSLTWLQ